MQHRGHCHARIIHAPRRPTVSEVVEVTVGNQRRLAVLGTAVATASVGFISFAAPVLAAPCGVGAPSLGNGGFESPGIAAGDERLVSTAEAAPWLTTDSGIEIWGDGFLGVPAQEGVDFAEINADNPGTLYQDVVTTPGATMTWSLYHHGREGTDVMKVMIGDAATADVNSDTGWNDTSPDLSDDTSAWGHHTGTYVVPAGQTCTRFGFRSVSTANGNPSVGNLLDNITFSVSVPAEPTPRRTARPTAAPTARPTTPPTDLAAGRPGGYDSAGIVIALLAVTAAISLLVVSRRRAVR